MNEDGTRNSAILLMSLGEGGAASVFQHLNPREIQRLGLAMSKLRNVTREEIAEVLERFRVEAGQLLAPSLDSDGYIRSVLTKALGSDRAASLIDEILDSNVPAGIDRLNQLPTVEVVELIRDEHPQIIATLLVHLDRGKASEVLELLPERLRNDVVLRVATFGGIQPEALNELTDVISGLLSGPGAKRSRLGGVRVAAEIINMMSSTNEEDVIKHVREHDNDLAQRIVDEMFVFEDLLKLEDRAIQLVLKEVESESLIIALKGAPEELRDKFLRNMSQRAAEILAEDIQLRGPVRVSQVEKEQKTVLDIVRRLADSGEIVIGNTGEDEYV
jgi:flagellar motor switch protein FliG